jgi:hypothetical protein
MVHLEKLVFYRKKAVGAQQGVNFKKRKLNPGVDNLAHKHRFVIEV